jgi:hypothetical protein
MHAMETLDWEEFRGDRPVWAAYQQLTGLLARQNLPRRVALYHAPLTRKKLAPFRYATRDTEHIVVEKGPQADSHSIVHELIHAILMAEGYHWIRGNLDHFLMSALSNELQHPEVFRRMEEEYKLDMAPYWEGWPAKLQHGLEGMRRERSNPQWWFTQFPRIVPWFWFQRVSGPFLEEYRAIDPTIFGIAYKAYEDTETFGFRTMPTNRQCLEIIKAYWVYYCEEAVRHRWFGPDVLQAVKGYQIQPLWDFIQTRTERNFANYIQRSGLLQPDGPGP